jgi:hypothetical protein
MKVAVISANCGSFDENLQASHKQQSINTDFYYFDDNNFPLRTKALHSRLQAKIPKMFGWDMVKGKYDYYIWMDAVIMMTDKDAVKWLIEQLDNNDIAFFRHQDYRPNIEQELIFMENHMGGKTYNEFAKGYLNERYATEPMRKQVEYYLSDSLFTDCNLYAAGMFIYKNKQNVKSMLKDWFTENARWSVQDQLSLPYVLSKSDCRISVIDAEIVNNKYTEYYWRNETNMHKWDNLYKDLDNKPGAFMFGDTESYISGARFLMDCEIVEDWGVGAGGFKRYRPDAIGIDGSITPFADKIEDLVNYKSECDGIFMRHVLEHDRNWKLILTNAISSAKKKLMIVLFIPLSGGKTEEILEGTEANKNMGVNVPNLSIAIDDFMDIISPYVETIDQENMISDTQYGQEVLFYITKKHE